MLNCIVIDVAFENWIKCHVRVLAKTRKRK